MSGEDASSSGAGSGGGVAIPYDYSSNTSKHERSANHNKPPMFNGDPKMFSLRGRPRCIVTSWEWMMSCGIFLKKVLEI